MKLGELGEKEVIVNFAIENEGNFKKCLLIGFNFDDIKKTVIIKFLRELKEELRESLTDEWEIDITENPFVKFSGIFITKKNWDKKFSIGIEAQNIMARDIVIGIGKDGKKITQKVGNGKLIDQLNAKGKPGRTSETWEWYRYLEGIYGNWDNEEALIEIYKKKDFVEFFKKQFLEIKDIATPLIDDEMGINK